MSAEKLEELDKRIIELLEEGYSLHEIARRLGVSYRRVRSVALSTGHATRRSGRDIYRRAIRAITAFMVVELRGYITRREARPLIFGKLKWRSFVKIAEELGYRSLVLINRNGILARQRVELVYNSARPEPAAMYIARLLRRGIPPHTLAYKLRLAGMDGHDRLIEAVLRAYRVLEVQQISEAREKLAYEQY